MTFLPLLIAILLSAQPAVRSDGFGQEDSWWQCGHTFRLGEGPTALSGRLDRSAPQDGSLVSGTYQYWTRDLRATFRLVDTPQGIRLALSHLSVEIPPAASPDGGEIHGYLFADQEMIAARRLLDARNARRGYGTSNASFEGFEDPRLARANRWSLVVLHSGGTQILRRDLPVPDRSTRDEAFAAHLAAIDAAWQRRDPLRLITTPADRLPPGEAHCLFSTPAARDEMMMSQITVGE